MATVIANGVVPWTLNEHPLSVGDLCYFLEREESWSSSNDYRNLYYSCCKHGTVTQILDGNRVEVEFIRKNPAESRDDGYHTCRGVLPLSDVYPFTQDGKALAEDRFKKKWFGKLCLGCEFFEREDYGWEPNCKTCKNKRPRYKKYGENSVLHDFTCDKSGLNLRVAENDRPIGAEFCKYYDPVWPQDKPIWISYESWMEHLKSCTFNPDCIHHRYSSWKTIPFDKWLHGIHKMFVRATYNGRPIVEIAFPRIHHLNMDFYLGDNKIMAEKVRYKPELTKNGLLKKGFTYCDWDDCPEGFIVLDALPDEQFEQQALQASAYGGDLDK